MSRYGLLVYIFSSSLPIALAGNNVSAFYSNKDPANQQPCPIQYVDAIPEFADPGVETYTVSTAAFGNSTFIS